MSGSRDAASFQAQAFGGVEAGVPSQRTCLDIPVRRHPARPAEMAGLAKPNRLHVSDRQRKLDIPFELLAEMEEHRIGQWLAAVAVRQEALTNLDTGVEYPMRPPVVEIPLDGLAPSSPEQFVEIAPVIPGLRIWGFVSITDSVTQHVTLRTSK